MQIEFDPAKNAANIAKHGVLLSLASEFNWETMLSWHDLRKNYTELRCIGLVPLEARLYYVAFVDRAQVRRIISLRKANLREFKHYEIHFQNPIRSDVDSANP